MAGNQLAVHSSLMAWQAALGRTDELFALLADAALYERPVPERHRLIFYLGHVDTFDWNLLARRPSFRPEFDKLFEFGIDPEPGCLPNDQPGDWPREREVREYVARLRADLEARIVEAPDELVQTAIEHRLMHAETLCYLIHNLPYDHKIGHSTFAPGEPPEARWVRIPAGTATLGREPGDGFGWDNEFGRQRVAVPGFEIQSHKVTNGEYLRFVEQGGPVPHYWTRSLDGAWALRGMFAAAPLPQHHPVYVTHAQATAYAKWVGVDLPTEPQWQLAAYGQEGRAYPWGSEPPDAARGNFDFQHWDTVPVTGYPAGDTPSGLRQMLGNGWEWTATVFGPLPGFSPRPYYPGYSANFFDSDHYVMKGGSPRTAAALLRHSFRNWFRPNYEYVYATLRCVRNN